MNAALAQEIQHHVNQYLAGAISLAQFEDWFVPDALLELDSIDDPDLKKLVLSIELLLAEYGYGRVPESALKTELRSVAQRNESAHQNVHIVFAHRPVTYSGGTIVFSGGIGIAAHSDAEFSQRVESLLAKYSSTLITSWLGVPTPLTPSDESETDIRMATLTPR